MTPKVSIIVPVYNAGERLRPCLDSLLNQTLNDIEIILVLDCPTDGSADVAEEYAATDKRIKLIHNAQNLNIGFSRNEGLKIATGEYIGFSDHDDYCEPQMFERLYAKAAETGADIVLSDVGENIDGKKYTTGFPDVKSSTPDALESFRLQYLKALISGAFSVRGTKSFNNCNSIWNQIYRRTLLTKNNICFADNRVLSYEDSLFSIAAYAAATKVEYIPEAFYYHIMTGGNEFSSYGYKSFAKTRCYLNCLSAMMAESGLDYKEEFAENAFHKLYSSLLNERMFKGAAAAFKLLKQIKKDGELVGWVSAVNKDASYMTLPKRLVLRYLLS